MRQGADFSAAVRGGARGATPRLVVHLDAADATPDAGPAVVGFVVSRAVGDAVTRNTVKRRLRHLARARLAAVPAGGRLVVRALPAAAGATSESLGADLDDALARARRKLSGARR